MSKVKIISDSTCDLSEELLIQYDIAVLPHPIVRDGELLQDNVSITPDDIYAHYERTGRLCTTSAPNAYDYEQFWRPWLDEGYEIVHFTISSEMSTAYNQAVLAAEETGHVYPVDSRSLSTGIGLLVVEAAIMAADGKSREEIRNRISELIPKVRASFVVDTLVYLYRGGRCSAVSALIGGALALHPMIVVKDGKMDASKKYRGKIGKVIKNYARDLENDMKNAMPDRVFITYSE